MKVIELEIGLIKPYENNAKMHPDSQIDNVATSIKKYGWQQPIVVDKNYTIIIGHCRHLAAQKLGLTTVPVVVADNLDDKQVKALRLVDNKSNESGWDLELVKTEIPDLDWEGFDFDWGIPEEEPEVHEDEDFDVDLATPTVAKSKLGDIYELGEHRLMCGDSTKKEDVEKLMGEDLADLLVTDPPYNVNYEGGTGMKIQNDAQTDSAFYAFLTDAFAAADSVMKEGCPFYIWFADVETQNFINAIKNQNWKFCETLIWLKNSLNLGMKDYQFKHEPCFYGWKEGAAHYFVDDRTQTTILEYDKPRKNDLHPTMKPVPLISKITANSSKKGEIVLDLFGGSGSTLIACEQLQRKCRMMEYDPIYCDVIITRWEQLTGQKAKKVN